MEAVSTSETPVNVYETTRCNIPEDSRLHTRRCENPKSHNVERNFNIGYEGLEGVQLVHDKDQCGVL
jgi:hypothetical protein